MADLIDVVLEEGPCNAKILHLTPDQLKAGALTCQGVTYVAWLPQKGTASPVWIPAASAKAKTAKGRAFDPTAVAAAWHRLMHTLAVRAPHHIRRQHTANARLHRLSRTGRM